MATPIIFDILDELQHVTPEALDAEIRRLRRRLAMLVAMQEALAEQREEDEDETMRFPAAAVSDAVEEPVAVEPVEKDDATPAAEKRSSGPTRRMIIAQIIACGVLRCRPVLHHWCWRRCWLRW